VFDREDFVGVLLLGLCLVVGGVLVYSIATGTRFRFTGPSWVGVALMVLFFGAVVYGLASSRRGRWPDPRTGGKRRWRWPWQRSNDAE